MDGNTFGLPSQSPAVEVIYRYVTLSAGSQGSCEKHKKDEAIECQVAEPHYLKVQPVAINYLGKNKKGSDNQADAADEILCFF